MRAVLGTMALLMVLAGCERGLHRDVRPAEVQTAHAYTAVQGWQLFTPTGTGTVVYCWGGGGCSSSGRRGAPVDAGEPPVSEALLSRGRTQFEVFCTPCHSEVGDGDGMIARRGFPAPPSYHIPRLRDAPDSHFYDAITNGYGVMYPYADRIARTTGGPLLPIYARCN